MDCGGVAQEVRLATGFLHIAEEAEDLIGLTSAAEGLHEGVVVVWMAPAGLGSGRRRRWRR